MIVSKTIKPKGFASSNLAASASLKVYTSDRLGFDKRKALESDVVIVGGRILKNRHGKTGVDIGYSIYVWGEMEED